LPITREDRVNISGSAQPVNTFKEPNRSVDALFFQSSLLEKLKTTINFKQPMGIGAHHAEGRVDPDDLAKKNP
jgi:hypothetical protein